MKSERADDLGLDLRALHSEPVGLELSLERIERNVMDRIERPASKLRALVFATPARIAGICLLGGLAVGASTVVALEQMGLSVVHSDGEEYVRIADPSGATRALLPVETGEGAGLVHRLESGSSLLSLDSGAGARQVDDGEAASTPRVFHVEASGADDAEADLLIRSPDGREMRVRKVGGGPK